MYISVAGVSRVNVDTSMLSHREKKKAVLRSTSSTSYFISFLLAELKISQKKGDKINAFFFLVEEKNGVNHEWGKRVGSTRVNIGVVGFPLGQSISSDISIFMAID